MPTINATLSYVYYPNPQDPVGFEGTLDVYDATQTGGADQYTTVLVIDPTNCSYWSLNKKYATGKRSIDGTNLNMPAQAYDPNGITATWTEGVSDQAANKTRYFIRGRFSGAGGLVQLQAQSVDMADPANTVSLQLAIPIPAGS